MCKTRTVHITMHNCVLYAIYVRVFVLVCVSFSFLYYPLFPFVIWCDWWCSMCMQLQLQLLMLSKAFLDVYFNFPLENRHMMLVRTQPIFEMQWKRARDKMHNKNVNDITSFCAVRLIWRAEKKINHHAHLQVKYINVQAASHAHCKSTTITIATNSKMKNEKPKKIKTENWKKLSLTESSLQKQLKTEKTKSLRTQINSAFRINNATENNHRWNNTTNKKNSKIEKIRRWKTQKPFTDENKYFLLLNNTTSRFKLILDFFPLQLSTI